MVRYETYRASAVEAPLLRRWVFFGLLASLALHAGLYFYFRQHQVAGFTMDENRPATARVFHIKQVSIPAMPEEQKVSIPEKAAKLASITIPKDKPEASEVFLAPQVPQLPKTTFNEKPKVDPAASESLAKASATSRNALEKELTNIAQSFIKEGPRSPRQPLLAAGSGKAGSGPGEGDANLSIPGLNSVDDLLSQTGGLKAGDRAAMPGGALFDYDHYDLVPQAMTALEKLGAIIQHNPRATFTIEGHSDSFGPPDYNLKLSEKRAEAVKEWLVEALHIAPERIQTRGFGNTKPLVSADKSKEEQAPNRRVEIVVRTNRK